MFQLTTSRRGRRTIWFGTESFINVSTHDLTKRSTDILGSSLISIFVSTHDLTKRSTASADGSKMQVRCFNSRPHEEVDYDPASEKTREIGVSTHDLTKRSTSAYLVSQAQLEFQLTTSRRGRHSIVRAVIWLFICFNSRPHEEVDSSLLS